MEREGLTFGAWRRRVVDLVGARVSVVYHHLLLDGDSLIDDYRSGLSVESAVRARVKDSEAIFRS